jgi:hypothetical protein
MLAINTTAPIYLNRYNQSVVFGFQGHPRRPSIAAHVCIPTNLAQTSVARRCCVEQFHVQPLSAPAVLPLYRSTLERRSEGQTRRVWSTYRPLPLQNKSAEPDSR